MKNRAGLVLLLVVVVVVIVVSQMNKAKTGPNAGDTASPNGQPALNLKGYVGGEKINFLKDPDVIKILQERYGLHLDFNKRGSLEMVEDPTAADQDFLWPSSQVALELYKEKQRPLVEADIIFNSPIILYSWANVTDALIAQKLVQKIQNAYYVVDFPKLIKAINSKTQWKAMGLPQLYGKVTIFSTDPTKSNSGNMFAGLLASVLNGGEVVTDGTLGKVMPTVKTYFDNQGFMEQSSEDIFQQFLNKGVGDKPIIVGYEAQLLEYSVAQPQDLTSRRETIRMLYPKPTVWSSHPLIAINANGKRLLTALQDKDIQRIAWQRHGFRSASGMASDLKAFPVVGIPETIENVIPMPTPRVMKRIIHELGGQ